MGMPHYACLLWSLAERHYQGNNANGVGQGPKLLKDKRPANLLAFKDTFSIPIMRSLKRTLRYALRIASRYSGCLTVGQ
jgi:hypothetical protein